MTETGSTLTIRPHRTTIQVEAPSDDDPSPGVGRDWFTGAAPAARSPWKGTRRVGMK